MTRRLKILAMKPRPEPQTIAMEAFITSEPLELEYLHTVLAGDHDVTLLDGMVDRRDPVRLACSMGADVVLVTSFITNVPTVLRTARALKAGTRPPLVFVGGPHAEVCPGHFADPSVDGVFFADALNGVREAMARVAAGLPFHDVPGAAFPPSWTVIPAPPLDPAALPVPDRVLYRKDPRRYFYLYFDRCASVKTAFGCPERCAFCFCTEQHGGRYGPRPLPAVVDEIAGIGAPSVFLLDDNFLTSPARVLEFCRLVEERGLHRTTRFIAYGTADFVARNPGVMARLRDAGLAGLIVGFEFVTDDALAAVNKRARLADNDACLALCRSLDVEVFALFVVDPDWPRAEFRRLEAYVRDRGIAFATFSTLTTLPGTALARETGAHGGDVPTAGWRYDLLRLSNRPRHMSRLAFYLGLFRLYLLPGFHKDTARTLRRRYGRWGAIRATIAAIGTGATFLWRLLRWG